MILVQNVSSLENDRTFVVNLLANGTPKTYRLVVELLTVDGKTIERIVCEDELTQLLHTYPATARPFFRMIGNLYHGKNIEFPVDLDAGKYERIA